MKLSVKPVPAARILMRTSPGPGSGMVGCSANSRTSGPPKRVIQMCCHDMIALSYHGSDVIAVESVFVCLLNQRSDVREWQILLQKSQKAQRLISRQTTKQATIADQ